MEMLKSILAQLHYTHGIMEWERKGVPFRSCMYVPEVHPLTGTPFHEREDEAHVFKVSYRRIFIADECTNNYFVAVFSGLARVSEKEGHLS